MRRCSRTSLLGKGSFAVCDGHVLRVHPVGVMTSNLLSRDASAELTHSLPTGGGAVSGPVHMTSQYRVFKAGFRGRKPSSGLPTILI